MMKLEDLEYALPAVGGSTAISPISSEIGELFLIIDWVTK